MLERSSVLEKGNFAIDLQVKVGQKECSILTLHTSRFLYPRFSLLCLVTTRDSKESEPVISGVGVTIILNI